jgi:hypothetical protein
MSSFLLLSIERRTFGFQNSWFDFLDTGTAGIAGIAGADGTDGTATATATTSGSSTGSGTSIWPANGIVV